MMSGKQTSGQLTKLMRVANAFNRNVRQFHEYKLT
jgi:hypothetical protein